MRRRPWFVVLAGLPLLAGGCGGGGGSSAANANIVVSADVTQADVDVGLFFKATYNIDGDPKYQGVKVSLNGPGSIQVENNLLYGYVTTYTAPTTGAGATATITASSVTDPSKLITTAVTIHDAIDFPDQTLPAATAGKSYSYTFTASGGTQPLRYLVSVFDGDPPPGLTLSSSGVFEGMPTQTGTYSFAVEAADSATRSTGVLRHFTMLVQ